MSESQPQPGWWQASDGKWYPPEARTQTTPPPGWWQASDGKWYPPEARTTPAAPAPEVPADPNRGADGHLPPAMAPPSSAAARIQPAPDPDVWSVPPLADQATTDDADPAADDEAAADDQATTDADDDQATTDEATDEAADDEAADDEADQAAADDQAATDADDDQAATDEATTAPKKKARKKVVKKVAVKKSTKASTAAPAAAPTEAPKPAKAAKKKSGVTRRQDLDDLEPEEEIVYSGRTPEEQIAIRDQTSQKDRVHLASARAAAATRALGTLQAQIAAELAEQGGPTAIERVELPEPTPAATSAPPPSATAPPPEPAPASEGPAGAAPEANESDFSRGSTRTEPSEEPLLSVRPSTVASDLDRIGERLLVFEDRVELRDRLGRARRTIPGDQIADVVVAKRFTGTMITVEAGDGSTIQMKGLKPELGEEARDLIMRRTRRVGPAPERTDRPAGPIAAAEHDDLLDKLEALHRAGVLSDAELAEKVAKVEQMAGNDGPLAATPS